MADLTIRARWAGDDVQRGVDSLKSTIGSLKQIAAGLGLAFGLDQIRQGLQAVIKDTADEEQTLARMSRALKNAGASGDDIGRITAHIGRLQDTTQFADDAIAAAFTRMVQSTGNASASLANLSVVMDVAAGTGKSLEEAGQIVAMAMEGQVRALGQLIPSLKSYMENLEGTESVAARSALAMEAINKTFGGAARADLDTYNASLAALKNSFGELGNELANKSGVLGFMQQLAQGAQVWAVALREGITLAEAMAQISAPNLPGLQGGVPLANGGLPVSTPRGSDSPLGGGPGSPATIDGLTMPTFGLRQRGMRGGAGSIDREMRDLGGMTADALEESRKRMEESIRQFADVSRQPMREIAMELQQGLMGAFSAARGGWQSLVDYMKDYLANVLGQYITGSLLNALIPGAGLSTGLLGKAFGGGGASFQAQAAGNFSAQMRAMRLG